MIAQLFVAALLAAPGDVVVVETGDAIAVRGVGAEYPADASVVFEVVPPRRGVLRARVEAALLRGGRDGVTVSQAVRDYDRYDRVDHLRFDLAPPRAERYGVYALRVRVRGLRADSPETALTSFEIERHWPLRWPERGPDAPAGGRLSGRVLFAVEGHALDDAARAQIAEWVAILVRAPGLTAVRVDGFADATGSRDYNLWLSRARERAVGEALVAAGVAAERVATVGHGESAAARAGEVPAPDDRRVEITWFSDVPEEEAP